MTSSMIESALCGLKQKLELGLFELQTQMPNLLSWLQTETEEEEEEEEDWP